MPSTKLDSFLGLMLLLVLTGLTEAAPGATAPADLPPLTDWHYWGRDEGAGSSQVTADGYDGRPAARVEYNGRRDWAFFPQLDIKVQPGDIWELSAVARHEGSGAAGLCFTILDADGKVMDWSAGDKRVSGEARWKPLKTRVIAPEGAAIFRPRATGDGPGRFYMADVKLTGKGSIMAGLGKLPDRLRFGNSALSVEFDPRKQVFAVTDLRTGKLWQQTGASRSLFVKEAREVAGGIEVKCLDGVDDRPVTLRAELDGEKPELVVRLASSGGMAQPLRFPGPFTTPAGTYLVVPMNEGISYPVEDPDVPQWSLVAYGGHGICMPFFGATGAQDGYMAIVQTPDDAQVQIGRTNGLAWVAPVWESQRGQFGYERSVRYVFLENGGHVAMAKRYRQYAQEHGLLKTLAEKRKQRPAIDKLVGAANTWYWEWDGKDVEMAREMLSLGMERLLWSRATTPEVIKQINAMGLLTSRYDIYQDTMNPAEFPRLQWKHPDWTTSAWPRDLTLRANGDWERGWEIETKDGKMIPCGVLCDRQAIPYAVRRIGEDLKDHPYQCRFIDTTTAAPWRECYSPEHPMTRSQSRKFKMDLLAVVSQRYGLVCGSETGHDAAVPVCDYFEGMLSLGPYRVDDAGRAMDKILTEVPPQISKFQLGWKYRLPLWELVYHDCLVAHWYWGDYNNKLPAVWDRRDQFNALYGTAPMYMFKRQFWEKNKDRFVQSYKATVPIARAAGYSEMTDHRFLTADRSVQQTRFANGVVVTVNFGQSRFSSADGTIIEPGAIKAEGLGK